MMDDVNDEFDRTERDEVEIATFWGLIASGWAYAPAWLWLEMWAWQPKRAEDGHPLNERRDLLRKMFGGVLSLTRGGPLPRELRELVGDDPGDDSDLRGTAAGVRDIILEECASDEIEAGRAARQSHPNHPQPDEQEVDEIVDQREILMHVLCDDDGKMLRAKIEAMGGIDADR
jgi:hypothetical protein